MVPLLLLFLLCCSGCTIKNAIKSNTNAHKDDIKTDFYLRFFLPFLIVLVAITSGLPKKFYAFCKRMSRKVNKTIDFFKHIDWAHFLRLNVIVSDSTDDIFVSLLSSIILWVLSRRVAVGPNYVLSSFIFYISAMMLALRAIYDCMVLIVANYYKSRTLSRIEDLIKTIVSS